MWNFKITEEDLLEFEEFEDKAENTTVEEQPFVNDEEELEEEVEIDKRNEQYEEDDDYWIYWVDPEYGYIEEEDDNEDYNLYNENE